MGMSDFAQDFKLQANGKCKLVSGYVACLLKWLHAILETDFKEHRLT